MSTITTANTDWYGIHKNIELLAAANGLSDSNGVVHLLCSTVSDLCDATENVLRAASRLQVESTDIIDQVNRNLGLTAPNNIARYAADLSEAAGRRDLAAKTAMKFINLLADEVVGADAHDAFRADLKFVIFGETMA
jgi:hypothetical protein